MSQGTHWHRAIVGSHTANVFFRYQGCFCAQFSRTSCGGNSGWPPAHHDDIKHGFLLWCFVFKRFAQDDCYEGEYSAKESQSTNISVKTYSIFGFHQC
jgi:hypothetical protein